MDTSEVLDVTCRVAGVLDRLGVEYLVGGVSERQWSDVIGILRVQKGRLDAAYLDKISHLLGVEDLLSKALAEAGPNEKA